jgi:tetratricopeptide (TPR) repeat protein
LKVDNKIITGVILMVLSMNLSSCGDFFKNPLFKLPSVARVQGDEYRNQSLLDLEKKVKKYEGQINKRIEAGDRLLYVYEALGTKFLLRQNFTEAVRFLEKAVAAGNDGDEVHRNLATAYSNLGRSLNSAKDYDQALYHYKLALEKNPDNRRASYGYALVLFYGVDRRREALQVMDRLITEHSDFLDPYFAYGRMLYESGEAGKALGVYKRLLQVRGSGRDSLSKAQLRDLDANIQRLTIELSGADK